MRTCCVVADPGTAVGFRLAGVDVVVAADGREAETHVAAIVEKGECGLLLINESLVAGVGERTLRRIEREGLPLMVPLPLEMAWRGEERGLEYILRLIRRSIGYQMRIRR